MSSVPNALSAAGIQWLKENGLRISGKKDRRFYVAWMVYDYPDPPLGYMDAEWPVPDEWEEYEMYEDDENGYDEYDEESFP